MLLSLFILSALSFTPTSFADLASRQAVVVRTADWAASAGTLQRYARSSPKEAWRPVDEAIPVVVGRNGLGWGLGLHPVADRDDARDGGPEKKEGDGRAPGGVFRLSSAFGYLPASQTSWCKLPYREATPSLRCVDDVSSSCYNRIVDTGLIKPDWKSAEEMLRTDDQYRLGIVVDHNTNPATPGRGSCIFIHIWKGSQTGTAGCTAMSQENMERLLRWLDPSANPVLIQLPATTYENLRPVWGLP